MAEAHIAALLPTQNRVVSADENTAFLAHYDLNEHDVLRNVKAIGYNKIMSLSGYVSTPAIEASMFSSPYTVEAWINLNSTTGDQPVFSIGVGGSSNLLHMVIRSGKPYHAYYSNDLQGVALLSINTWYHVAFVYDGANQLIYINGALDSSRATTGFLGSSTTNGRIGFYASSSFNGRMKDFRIYARAKTVGEIKDGMHNINFNEQGLRAYYKMNDENAILRDSSAFHNDATATGTLSWVKDSNSIFTLRNKEGYFGGGALAVEEGTTNIIPSPTINSYPTVGNGWGTYQTNQYNSGAYFSIGTITSVINNEVTVVWAEGRKFRTYDVVRPQTTGGGLTAATDYFIKMTSDTTFTIHKYDGTQDGSKGFGVHDSINNDIRIAINATDFPTMWNGRAHAANSGLVKEVIRNGFSNNGVTHDCLRMYTNHTGPGESWGDYIAYGVNPTITANTQYAVSFYYRAVTPETIGRTVQYQMHNGAGFGYGSFVLQRDWQRYEAVVTSTVTGGCSLYWNAGKGVVWDLAEIQVEQRGSATSFTTETRADGSLLYPNPIPNATEFTISCWMKKTGNSSTTQQAFLCIDQGTNADGIWLDEYANQLRAFIYPTDGSAAPIAATQTYNISEWTHVTIVGTQSYLKLYVNGEQAGAAAITSPYKIVGQLSIGRRLAVSARSNVLIDELRIDSVSRTAEEISAWYYSNSPFWPRGIYRKPY